MNVTWMHKAENQSLWCGNVLLILILRQKFILRKIAEAKHCVNAANFFLILQLLMIFPVSILNTSL